MGVNIEKSERVGSGDRLCPPQLGVWGLPPEKYQFCAKNCAIMSKFWYFFPTSRTFSMQKLLPAHHRKWGIIPSPKNGGHIPLSPYPPAPPPAPMPMLPVYRYWQIRNKLNVTKFIDDIVFYYAALLPRRGRILRCTLSVRLSVCPSVCPSVPLLLPSVTSRHLANYNDTHVLFGTHRGPHIVRPSRPHKLVNIRMHGSAPLRNPAG